MSWEDIKKILMTRFPVEEVEPVPGTRLTKTRRLTTEVHAEWLYSLACNLSNDAWICEIGTLYGFLTAMFGFSCQTTNRRVVTIDHMIGSHCMDMRSRDKCIYLEFIDNMISLGIWDKIIPFPMKSFSYFGIPDFGDTIIPEIEINNRYFQAFEMLLLMKAEFELIYIDGNHSYSNVSEELKRYSELLKPGGLICGDDCNAYGHSFLKSFLFDQKNFEDVPAVAQAMLKFFNGNNNFEPIDVPIGQFGFRKV